VPAVVIEVVALATPAVFPFIARVRKQKPGLYSSWFGFRVLQTYKQGNDTYTFRYKLSPTNTSGLLYVTKNVEETSHFPEVPGSN
jgi:hypothetical protein